MEESEFALIRRYFTRPAPDGVLGVGDDCALLPPFAGLLATSTDTLVEGTHFFSDVDPHTLGHKALAVNLSDLAAMGATPRGFLLAIALPRVDHAWLQAFSEGLLALADAHGCPLVGGDTTRSAHGITITITVFGEVPAGEALRRDGAQPHDEVWVSGTLGDADVALKLLQHRLDLPATVGPAPLLAATRAALELPEPRLALGQALRGVASAAIDISDGLAQDLGHLLAASGVGAELQLAALPLSPALSLLPAELAQHSALTGGDVYELCFTAPPSARPTLVSLGERLGLRLTCIGRIVAGDGLRALNAQGDPVATPAGGFDHFAQPAWPAAAGSADDDLAVPAAPV